MPLAALEPAPAPLAAIEPLHILPGRLRARLHGLRHNPEAEDLLRNSLRARPGILSLTINVWAGTVLVQFDPSLDPATLLLLLEAALRGQLPHLPAPPDEPAPEPTKGLRAWLANLLPKPAPPQEPPAFLQTGDLFWHALTPANTLQHLESHAKGLTHAEIERRLHAAGRNTLPTKPRRSLFALFLDQLNSVPVLLLVGSATVSLLTGGVVDGLVILAVVVINASLGCATERHAERTIETLTRLDEPEALLMRDGRVERIDSADIVPGDILLLPRGAYIPADARILEAQNLSVAESALTGESAPIVKHPEPLSPVTLLADRANMVYRGTVVTGGSGIALVVATGVHTEIGRIHSLINEAFRPETPMERQLDDLGRQTAYAAAAICGITLVFGWIRGFGLLESLRSAVSLAVAALPEGLPTMSTTALAFGMMRMREHNVLARNLGAVETIGAINLLCLDKTGTLTANRMAVVEVFAAAERLTPEAVRARTRPAAAEANPHLEMLLAVCALCSEAEPIPNTFPPEFTGSPTEVAILELVCGAHLGVADLRKRFPLLHLQARTESRNFMVTVHAAPRERRLLAIKGSPDEVLARCNRIVTPSGTKPLDKSSSRKILAENERMASNARRVLACAFLEIDASGPIPESGFHWLGLVGLTDPPRDGVHDAMRMLHRAGIDTRMVTGDQRATAFATGSDIGLWEPHQPAEVFDARQSPGPLTFDAAALESRIFARVNPSQKLDIVQALQRQGRVVGMTGDGINDGPALKAADVGIALGPQSTETARESADLVLQTDDLRSLVAAIREGRAIHNNIRQAVRFLITTNMSEVLSVLGSVAIGFGQPLTPRQLLWLNLVTDIFPVLSLAVEPAHAGTLDQPPPDPRLPLIAAKEFPLLLGESGLMAGAVALSYGFALRSYGSGRKATTMAFFSLTTAQLLHTLTTSIVQPGSPAAPPNKYIPLAVAGGLVLELVTMLPPFRGLLGLSSLSLLDGGVCVASVTTSSLATVLLRWFAHRNEAPSSRTQTEHLSLTVGSLRAP